MTIKTRKENEALVESTSNATNQWVNDLLSQKDRINADYLNALSQLGYQVSKLVGDETTLPSDLTGKTIIDIVELLNTNIKNATNTLGDLGWKVDTNGNFIWNDKFTLHLTNASGQPYDITNQYQAVHKKYVEDNFEIKATPIFRGEYLPTDTTNQRKILYKFSSLSTTDIFANGINHIETYIKIGNAIAKTNIVVGNGVNFKSQLDSSTANKYYYAWWEITPNGSNTYDYTLVVSGEQDNIVVSTTIKLLQGIVVNFPV